MRITTRIAAVAATGLLLVMGMTACDDEDKAPTETGGSSGSSQSADPSESVVPTVDPSDGITEDGKGDGVTTLSGTISKGVEAGCVLLVHDGVTYNLVGGDKSLLAEGAEVEVTGAVAEGLMTTCQQGTPFKVDQVTAK